MRIVIEIAPVVTVSLPAKAPKDLGVKDEITLCNNYKEKTIHYTATLNPTAILGNEKSQEKKIIC
ncbi:hypothetical protein ACT7DB_17320 [Bacillus cereus]